MIELPLASRFTKAFNNTVEAQLLPDIAPHLAHVATFAIHQGCADDTYYKGWWFVSNVETGCSVAYGYSRLRVLRQAKELLAQKTPRDLMAAYRKQTA